MTSLRREYLASQRRIRLCSACGLEQRPELALILVLDGRDELVGISWIWSREKWTK